MSGMKRKVCVKKEEKITTVVPRKRLRRMRNVKEELDEVIILRKCAELVDVLRNHKTTDNRTLCETFIRAPSRRTDPKYFDIITHPIDLTRIQQKIKTEEYDTVDDLAADISLLVSNNKAYYKEGSQEFEDACELWEIFDMHRRKIYEGISNTGIKECEKSLIQAKSDILLVDLFEEIIVSTLELTDVTGRLLSPPFRTLLPPEEFPSYYDRIKKPIDLKKIAQKIRTGKYRTWQQFDTDFRLMCKNAKSFNEVDSVISKDASLLLKNYVKRRAELSNFKSKPLTIKRINANKRILDELLTQSETTGFRGEYSEDSEEDDDSEQSNDQKWILYWTLRNELNPSDPETYLADPFLELPSKNWYPDYFDEIAQPMSLFMINKKLKRNDYGTFEEFLRDVLLVFSNAKSYNVEGSDIYEAAVKLERLAKSKAQMLQEDIKLWENDDTDKASNKSKQPSDFTVSGMKRLHRRHSGHPALPAHSLKSETSIGYLNFDSSKLQKLPTSSKSSDSFMQVFRSKLTTLWNAVCDYMDNGRRLANAFIALPSRTDYPEYYEYIRKPIDLTIIKQKIEADQYTSTDDFMKDMDLMFRNAWKFNEPGSQIYQDATILQSVVRNALSLISDIAIFNLEKCRNKTKKKSKVTSRKLKACTVDDETSRYNNLNIGNNISRCSTIKMPGIRCRTHLCDNVSSSPSCSTVYTNIASVSSPKNTMKSGRGTSRKSLIPSHVGSDAEKVELYEIYNLIRNHHDERGRELSIPFLQLPSKYDYPDYYDVIRKPIDLCKIRERISSNYYDSVDGLISDLILMFDNACRYNEPESMIYKDALSLKKIVLMKKRDLCKVAGSLINVQSEVQTLLSSILISVNNHQDSDGRCFSDSLADLPAMLRRKGVNSSNIPFSIDEMKRNIDKGRYRRLDVFQEDLFSLFDAALENTHSDSQIFEDTVELWLFYLKTRDDLTRTTLLSPARWYTEKLLITHVNDIRKRKLSKEAEDDEENKKSETLGPNADGDVVLDLMGQGGYIYRVNDYAYVAPVNDESVVQRHIMRIERLYRNCDGQTFARGIWCYQPEETFHLATRKFCENVGFSNEVFLTSYYDTITVDRLIGKCHVMPVRQFMKEKPKGFDDSDIYVCECRYMGRHLHFKKLKHWPYDAANENVEYVKREKSLTMLKRITSLLASRKILQVQHRVTERVDDNESIDSLSSLEDDRLKNLPAVLERKRVEVMSYGRPITLKENYILEVLESSSSSIIFYEQMFYDDRWFRLGDFVYVYNPLRNQNVILRVDKLWKTKEGDGFFSGPYFAHPCEIKHEPARLFYKQEVFAVDQPDIIIPLENVQGVCAVLPIKEYVRGRPTEIDECDVYVVESKVRGYGSEERRCSSASGKADVSEINNAEIDLRGVSIMDNKSGEICRKGGERCSINMAEMEYDAHSNVASTSGVIMRRTDSSGSTTRSVEEDLRHSVLQRTKSIVDKEQMLVSEEPMNDAFAKKLKHSLKVQLCSLFFIIDCKLLD
ncbi:unnamed protein product [Thelazia callipaeda]|uniref:Bromo domain-containing protein n=1 Tax=Thelazia callipaeda TaxID=103827 RepID=A0A0N5CNX0_THECL|nr:unnamed protein product [Thelazia callipaeda]